MDYVRKSETHQTVVIQFNMAFISFTILRLVTFIIYS